MNTSLREAILELESMDPDELVVLLGITPEEILRTFRWKTLDYIENNYDVHLVSEDIEYYAEGVDTIRGFEERGYSIVEPEPE